MFLPASPISYHFIPSFSSCQVTGEHAPLPRSHLYATVHWEAPSPQWMCQNILGGPQPVCVPVEIASLPVLCCKEACVPMICRGFFLEQAFPCLPTVTPSSQAPDRSPWWIWTRRKVLRQILLLANDSRPIAMLSLSAWLPQYTGRFLEDTLISHPDGLSSGSSQVPATGTWRGQEQ